MGEEYLQLSATNSFFLDRATIKYRLVINCLDGSCKMEMYNISYFHGDDTEMEAEDWITDETGLNKAKTKVDLPNMENSVSKQSICLMT